MTSRIDLEELRLRYEDTTAVDRVTCHLEGGKIYGLLGRNGSGKTSLLSMLAGFIRPTSGSVLVDGQPVFENPRAVSRICLIRDSGDVGDQSDTVRTVMEIAQVLRSTWDQEYAERLLEKLRSRCVNGSLNCRGDSGQPWGSRSGWPAGHR